MNRVMSLLLGLAAVLVAAQSSPPDQLGTVPPFRSGKGDSPRDWLGRVDTVGGTTYDWQLSGPMTQRIYFDSIHGLHLVWPYSAGRGPSYPDRNIRYNFWDITIPQWLFIDPTNFMNSGVSVFTLRVGFGNLDVNPLTGCAYVASWAGTNPGFPVVARDVAPGAGIFDESSGELSCSGYIWPVMALSNSGKAHVALADYTTQRGLYYSEISRWDTWSSPVHVSPPFPDPGPSSYLIAASQHHPWVSIVWTVSDSEPRRIYCRKSTDDGATWLAPDTLAMPPAFHPGSDTVPSISPVDLYPWYDPDEEEEDALHVVAGVYPVVGAQSHITPVELWHWSETAGWSRIARIGCDSAHLKGGIGLDAAYASRPSLAKYSDERQLVCVWEQFDSTNVEPRDSLLRADIWAARGDNLGRKWGAPVRLTDPDSTSKRFPCVASRMHGDTFMLTYEIDQCAGFGVLGQGPVTDNPIVVQYVSINDLPPLPLGIAEPNRLPGTRVSLRAEPNPFRHQVEFTAQAPTGIDLRLRIYDEAGRQVVQLAKDRMSAGMHHWQWRPNQAAPGVYFCELVTRSARSVRKLTLLP